MRLSLRNKPSLKRRGTSSGGGTPPAATAVDFGGLTTAGSGGYPVTGTSISSGDPSGLWTITSGYLVPSAAGDTANLNAGPYALVLNDASQYTVTVEANAWDVRTQAEWDTIIAQATATLAGKKIYVRPDSYRGGASIVSGVDGTAARLRRADYTPGLTIQGRVPAITAASGNNLPTAAADRATFDKFFLRGARNVTFRHLATTAVAETKFQLTGEAANHLFNITIDQCHVSGQVFDVNGDYSTSSNFPMFGKDLITCTGAANNASGSIAVTNCLVEYAGTGIGLRVDRDATSTYTVTGNVVRYFYDDGIGLSETTPTSSVFYNCVATVSDNIVYGNVGKSTDSGNPHNDAIRFIGYYTKTTDWTINVHRNRIWVGSTRGNGHMQGILASDKKSTSGDSGKHFLGSAVGNVIVSDNAVAFNIENARDFVALNSTVVSSVSGGGTYTPTLRIGQGSTNSTTSGTHRAERNAADAYDIGGTPTLTSNITLGKGGTTISYATAFDGSTWYPTTLAELMTSFARKAAGPLDIGAIDAGAIASGAVTWASTNPGSNGSNAVS